MYALGQGDPTGGHEAQWAEWDNIDIVKNTSKKKAPLSRGFLFI